MGDIIVGPVGDLLALGAKYDALAKENIALKAENAALKERERPLVEALRGFVDVFGSDERNENMQEAEMVECPECHILMWWPSGQPITRCCACVLQDARQLLAERGV